MTFLCFVSVPLGGPKEDAEGGSAPLACIHCAAPFATREQLDKHELLHSPNTQVVSTRLLGVATPKRSPYFSEGPISAEIAIISIIIPEVGFLSCLQKRG